MAGEVSQVAAILSSEVPGLDATTRRRGFFVVFLRGFGRV